MKNSELAILIEKILVIVNYVKKLSSLQQRLRDLIDDSKQIYFLRLTLKLNTIQKITKAYWALLRIVLNNRKTPIIPPLFHNNKFVNDLKDKS